MAKRNKFPRRPLIVVTEEKMIDGLTRRRVKTVFKHPSKTIQEPGAGCDINNIMAKYADLGISPYVKADNPELYGSFNKAKDFGEAADLVARTQQQFELLPSKLREKFQHKPENMLKWLESNDPNDIKDHIKYGFRELPKVELTPEPMKVVVVSNDGEVKKNA